ncbi:restriction endonuclease subunit S [uncultured Holdemanella sp.]|uniref:restriction endonuclease subunit S n=1 Tax=uncultured Holdemanella sp. TaxID=1763549 RepID=UPI0025DC5EC6|nr:restriction endonuclease subunit S [uncultured Holdemanella sp.]
MNKLQELIQTLCPGGIEYKELQEICHYSKNRINASEVDNTTYVGVENLLQNKQGKTLASSVPTTGNVIRFDIGDILIGNIRPYLKKIWLSDCVGGTNGDVLVVQINDRKIIIPEFLYYVLSSDAFFSYDMLYSKGAKMPRGNKVAVMQYRIPIPPMEIQQEIVRLLDDFTAKTAELQDKLNEELEARKKQYEYYRDAILNGDKNAETVKLGDVCDFVRGPFGGALKKDSFVSSGYAVYEQQHAIYQNTNIRYFIDSEKYNDLIRFKVSPNDIIVSCSGTIGKTYIIPNDAPKGIINQALLKLTAHDCLNVRYLQYIFENNLVKIMNNNARGGAIKNVPSVKELKNIEIQLPSNDTQDRIINILDNLESTCDNLQTNISVEFESRQKQYEFYRDKLLTFKELNESEVN